MIKDMEMPKNCLECEWHEYYGGDYDWCHACRKTGTMPIENAETQRADDCPLVKVKTPHGRLVEFIDATIYEDDDSESRRSICCIFQNARSKTSD